MSASTVILVIVIAVLAVFAGRKAAGAWSGKGGCHGGSGGAAKVKKVKVADTDEANYPYTADIKVSGMSCEDCARNIENAINALGETWASVDMRSGNAHVRAKKPIDVDAVEAAVRGAGYYIRQY